MGNIYHRALTILAMGLTTVSLQPLVAAGPLPQPRSTSRQQVPHHGQDKTPPGVAPTAAPATGPKPPNQPLASPPPATDIAPSVPPGAAEPGEPANPRDLTAEPNSLTLPSKPEQVTVSTTQSISLKAAIDLALDNSEELRLALLQLEKARAGLRAEQATLLPTVDLSGSLQNTNQNSQGSVTGAQSSTTVSGTVRTDYDLGLSGERGARLQVAEQQVRLAELQVEQTRQELRLNTTNDYYAVQQALSDIRINQAFLEEAQRNLRDTQLREQVGMGTRFDVLRADVQVANARQTLTQATSQREISQRQLSRRLNVPATVSLTTQGVEIAGNWPLSLEESIVAAYQNRVELQQQLVQRTLNDAQGQRQLAAGRPSLGLYGLYQVQSLLGSSTGSQSSTQDGFSLGARLNWRLFDGGAASARAEQSDRDLAISEVNFEKTRNDIRLQVEEAYYTLQANQANISTAKVSVRQAKEALELANLRFNAGVGTQLDVLSATRELTQAQGNLARATLDYNRALARMERAVSQPARSE